MFLIASLNFFSAAFFFSSFAFKVSGSGRSFDVFMSEGCGFLKLDLYFSGSFWINV
jgi:hypothetical protein